jgi:hypothetical protein
VGHPLLLLRDGLPGSKREGGGEIRRLFLCPLPFYVCSGGLFHVRSPDGEAPQHDGHSIEAEIPVRPDLAVFDGRSSAPHQVDYLFRVILR